MSAAESESALQRRRGGKEKGGTKQQQEREIKPHPRGHLIPWEENLKISLFSWIVVGLLTPWSFRELNPRSTWDTIHKIYPCGETGHILMHFSTFPLPAKYFRPGRTYQVIVSLAFIQPFCSTPLSVDLVPCFDVAFAEVGCVFQRLLILGRPFLVWDVRKPPRPGQKKTKKWNQQSLISRHPELFLVAEWFTLGLVTWSQAKRLACVISWSACPSRKEGKDVFANRLGGLA